MFLGPIKRNTCPNPIRATLQIKRNIFATGYTTQFEKDKMSVCAISSPNPTPASMEAILEAIQDLSMKIKAMALSS